MPPYQLRVDADGVPLILAGAGGFTGGMNDGSKVSVTRDGYVVVYDKNGIASGHEQFVLDPALQSANDVASDAAAAIVQTWDANPLRDLFDGSVAGGVHVGDPLVIAGMTRPTSTDDIFGLGGNGGTFPFREYQLRDGADAYDADGGFAARLTANNVSIDTSNFKRDLEIFAETGGDTFQMLIGSSPAGDMNRIRKLGVGALTGLAANAAGTRTVTAGGTLRNPADTTDDFMPDLVPGINDEVQAFAYNPLDGNLYFISVDAGNNKVYLSAVSFTWGATASNSIVSYVDLDPDSAATYLDITYLSSSVVEDSSGVDLVRSRDLAFNSGGTVLYVLNGDGEGTSNRVFQFDLRKLDHYLCYKAENTKKECVDGPNPGMACDKHEQCAYSNSELDIQEAKDGHWCMDNPDVFVPLSEVHLDDQFADGYFDVKGVKELCTPAEKTLAGGEPEPVIDEVTHLVSYEIDETKQECALCKGGVTSLNFENTDSVDHWVTITDKDGNVLYDALLLAGNNTGLILGVMKDMKWGTEVTLDICNDVGADCVQYTLHTSCSQPIGIGTTVGPLQVVDGTSKDVADSFLDQGASAVCSPPALVMKFPTACPECKGGVTHLTLLNIGGADLTGVTATDKDLNPLTNCNAVNLAVGQWVDCVGLESDNKMGSQIFVSTDAGGPYPVHTSCSQPIGPGLMIGDSLMVIDGASKDGGNGLCPLASATNQFETLVMAIDEPERLMVPSLKNLVDFAPDLSALGSVDHFQCYKIDAIKADYGQLFSLTDQFKEDRYFTLYKPKRLCNPVDKNGEGIINPDGHLACYEIKDVKGICSAGSPSNEGGVCDKDEQCGGDPGSGWCALQDNADEFDGLYVNNQFDDVAGQRVNIKDAQQLCVPSTKICGPVAQCSTGSPGDLDLVDACTGEVLQTIIGADACN